MIVKYALTLIKRAGVDLRRSVAATAAYWIGAALATVSPLAQVAGWGNTAALVASWIIFMVWGATVCCRWLRQQGL